MYLYSVNNKQEYFQKSKKKMHLYKPSSTPLGKILSELINFDYFKLIYVYTELLNKQKSFSFEQKDYIINKLYTDVCEETKLLIEDLLAPHWLARKVDYIEYLFELNLLISKIKTLVQLNICDSDNIDFIKYYFKDFKAKEIKKEMQERMTYVSKYINSNNDVLIFRYRIKDSDIHNYIASLDITNESDIPDGKVLFEGLVNYINRINENNDIVSRTNTIYDIELFKYLKSRLKYEYDKTVDINSLSQLILVSFINCCKNNIKPAKCEYCGNLYFKHGKSKYCCEGCLKAAKSQQKFNRNYIYIDSAGVKQTLIYDNVLRNFEGKVSKVIKYVNETDDITSDSSRKIIESRLYSYKLMYRNKRNNIEDKIAQSNNQNEKDAYYETVAKLLYKVENLYTERNSLKNVVKFSIEQNKNIILKCPKLNGHNVVDDDFVIEYLE